MTDEITQADRELSDACIKWHLRHIEPHLKDADAAVDTLVRGVRKAIAAARRQPAAVDEAMVFRLAVWMAKNEGHDDPHHLIWEGIPPEPWGEVWNRYEDDARAALTQQQESK